MKISFITTVFNEEKTILRLINSLLQQTKLPDEVIIVDGGSSDETVSKITNFVDSLEKEKSKAIHFKIIEKKGNRSVGRNEAVHKAKHEIIVCSDAGNVLDKNWIKNITKPFLKSKTVDVVAGYYEGKAINAFQKSVIPYALVMPDQVNPNNFLPATRSIAFTKSIWKKVGTFNELYSHNEDYVFATRLKDIGAHIVFAKDAIVYWQPRNTFKQAFIMMFRFAFGDAESGMERLKVLLLFARYILGLYFIFLTLLYKSYVGVFLLIIFIGLYIIWAIKKNYRYVQDRKALFYLPLLQLTADGAVLSGTMLGFVKRIRRFPFINFVKKNKIVTAIFFIYILIMVVLLNYGIPNAQRPFPYHMDEWHQLQAVRSTFAFGTPNRLGAANGTMFHFILSGFYLIPFTLLDIVNPVVLKLNDFVMRERVFLLLRINTLLWGLLSMIVMYKISRVVKLSSKITLFFFTITPIWISLSNLFKYDIGLLFWIVLSLYLILRFAQENKTKRFLFAALPVGLAIAVKVSAIPLIPIYMLSYLWFRKRKTWSIKHLAMGGGIIILSVLLFGMPDTLFGKGNILVYLKENVIEFAKDTANYQLGMHHFLYIFTAHYILLFGIVLYLLTIFALGFMGIAIAKHKKAVLQKYRIELFLCIAFIIFIVSLLPLHIYAGMNRSLVVLPFMVLLSTWVLQHMMMITKQKLVVTIVLTLLIVVQITDTIPWVYTKLARDPYQTSSAWVKTSIPPGHTIGIENIPIYQFLPDIIQKEYYFQDAKIDYPYYFTYSVIDAKTEKLPDFVIVSNDELHETLFKTSVKKDLLTRLRSERYQKIAVFHPDFAYASKFYTPKDFHIAGITAIPQSIAIYKRSY